MKNDRVNTKQLINALIDKTKRRELEWETIPEYFIYVKSPDGYANLRKGPGTEYDVICQIPTGDSMEVYRETARDQKGKKWLKVAYWHSEGTPLPDGTDDPGVWETGWISESQVE